jgi:hypothetical protein
MISSSLATSRPPAGLRSARRSSSVAGARPRPCAAPLVPTARPRRGRMQLSPVAVLSKEDDEIKEQSRKFRRTVMRALAAAVAVVVWGGCFSFGLCVL